MYTGDLLSPFWIKFYSSFWLYNNIFKKNITPWWQYISQSLKGMVVQGLYKPLDGNCAIYFYPSVKGSLFNQSGFLKTAHLVFSSFPVEKTPWKINPGVTYRRKVVLATNIVTRTFFFWRCIWGWSWGIYGGEIIPVKPIHKAIYRRYNPSYPSIFGHLSHPPTGFAIKYVPPLFSGF